MTTIYIVRHAQAEGNLYRRFHGQYNSLLTEAGHQQCAALAERFKGIHLDAIYSSDLIRARCTAEAIGRATGCPVQTDPRFREVQVGVWENRTFGDLILHESEQYARIHTDPRRWHVEGAEDLDTFTGRWIDGLRAHAAQHPSQTIAIVTHWMVLEQVLNLLFPGQWSGFCDNTAVTRVTFDGSDFHLDFAIDSSHLPEAISTYAMQRVLREHPELNYNFWFQSALGEPERYIRFRREAWELVYGNLDGFNGSDFWSTAVKTCEDDPDALVYAMCGTDIAGIIQLNVNGYAAQNAGYIPFLYLREPYRDKGLGVQLLGHAVMYFRAKGRTKLQLSVAPQNARAIRFYQKNGFTQIGTSGGRKNQLLLMEKDIDRERWM